MLLFALACEQPPSRPLPIVPDDTGVVDSAADSAVDTVDTAPPGPPYAPVLYGDDAVQSPITAWVADTLAAIASAGQPDVFMKVGASSTASSSTLHCFASDATTDLGAHTDLADTLAFFRAGDAAGSTPFDRDTEAAVSGMSAGWAISGDPSPIDEEIAAIDPRLAVVHYGTNDMGLGSTHDSAMPGFYRNMTELLDGLIDDGILPILTGISPRGDSASADEWAETYNALIRGLAQARQIPFIDLHLATWDLDGHGLSGDGLHLESYGGGACVLTDEGLEHGYNVRNLIVLDALDRVQRVLDGDDPPDDDLLVLQGGGTFDDPFAIAELPFSDFRDSRDALQAELDVYTGCDYDADESGPEWIYAITLADRTAIRAVVLDGEGVDIDLHLLDGTAESDCLLRSDRTIETTLDPGSYLFALDTYVSGGVEQGGDFLFFVLTCDAGDADCAG